jgi:hypothetical protein
MDLRKPEYLSPSAKKSFYENPKEYFLRYLSPLRIPKTPQTPAMAAGSAFDAYAKSYLHEMLFGRKDEKYDRRKLFEAQVEAQNRDECWIVGEYLFECYKDSGALAAMMDELSTAIDEPNFEFDLKGEIKGTREGVEGEPFGVPLLGKPDLRFINDQAAHVIYDWKVNGFYAKGNTSPKPGYVQCRDKSTGWWMKCGFHKDARVVPYKGIEINMNALLETVDAEWAGQIATYGWLMGEPVGSEFIAGIDQLVCHGGKRVSYKGYSFPSVRIANHRTRVGEKFQRQTLNEYVYLWSILSDINTDKFYFFRNMSFEDSKAMCASLVEQCRLTNDQNLTDVERWVMEVSR